MSAAESRRARLFWPARIAPPSPPAEPTREMLALMLPWKATQAMLSHIITTTELNVQLARALASKASMPHE